MIIKLEKVMLIFIEVSLMSVQLLSITTINLMVIQCYFLLGILVF